MHRIFPLICLTLCSFSTFAQNVLQGRVIDAQTREALPGASIQAASAGCLSDRQGHFSLPAVKAKDSIRISIIGYTPVQLAVNQDRNMTIYLEPLTTRLNEVIVSAGREK